LRRSARFEKADIVRSWQPAFCIAGPVYTSKYHVARADAAFIAAQLIRKYTATTIAIVITTQSALTLT
jgi:hypothetical protein